MRDMKFHIYKNIEGIDEPLCHYADDNTEYGTILEFETEESAEQFLQNSAEAEECGALDSDFFSGAFIKKDIVFCDGGYIQADGMYFGLDLELHKKEN